MIYSKVDFRSGYHQVKVKDENISKTNFRFRHGHYVCVLLPFRLLNAPTTFMHLMNDIFRQYLDKFIIVFLDDILIYSKSVEEHEDNLRLVLHVLRKNQLYANLSNCSLYIKNITWDISYLRNGQQQTQRILNP